MQGPILARFRKSWTENPGAEPGPANRFRNRWRWGLIAALAGLFVAWLIYLEWGRGFDWAAFGAGFLSLDWRWLAPSAGLALLAYYGRALRWAVMLEPLRPRPSRWNLFGATAIGFTATVLLGRPGEFVRPYLIAVKEKLPFSSQMAAWCLERLCDLLAILLVFGFALTRVEHSRARVGPALQWVFEVGGYLAAIIGVGCLVLLVLFRLFADRMRRRLLDALGFLSEQRYQRAERFVSAFVEGMGAAKKQAYLLKLTLYTVLEWVLISLCLLALFKAQPAIAGFGLQDVLIFLGFVSFGSIIQIPGVGGGIQVVSVIVLTELFGLPLELATTTAILVWLFTSVVIVPVGLFLGLHEGLNWRRLRDLERQAEAQAARGEA